MNGGGELSESEHQLAPAAQAQPRLAAVRGRAGGHTRAVTCLVSHLAVYPQDFSCGSCGGFSARWHRNTVGRQCVCKKLYEKKQRKLNGKNSHIRTAEFNGVHHSCLGLYLTQCFELGPDSNPFTPAVAVWVQV